MRTESPCEMSQVTGSLLGPRGLSGPNQRFPREAMARAVEVR